MGRVVLVTGVSQDLGKRFARRIAEDPAVGRVIGVDVVPPRGDLGRVHFVRADIRNPVIAKVIAGEDVDTVVHTSLSPALRGGGSAAKEHNVIGTMQLLAACQRAPGVERLVVKSSGAVYGSSSRDPAMFTEDLAARSALKHGFGKDVIEIEGYVRAFSRRRPDVTVTTLRPASPIGPGVQSPMTAYFRLAAIPRPVGFDARLQFVHEDDLLAVLHHATLAGVAGTINVAGDGILLLSQAVRRLGRPTVPLPQFAMRGFGSLLRSPALKVPGFAPEQVRFLTFGRGLDNTRMRTELGFEPSYTTEEAFDDFAASLKPGPLARHHPVVVLEEALAGARDGSKETHGG